MPPEGPLPFPGRAAAMMVDEHLAHRPGRGAKDVLTLGRGPEDVAREHPHQGLVDERAGLKRVVGALAAHHARGGAAEVLVEDRHEMVEGDRIAASYRSKELAVRRTVMGHGEAPKQMASGVRGF